MESRSSSTNPAGLPGGPVSQGFGPPRKLLPLVLLVIAGLCIAAAPFVVRYHNRPAADPGNSAVKTPAGGQGEAAPAPAPHSDAAPATPGAVACADCGEVLNVRTVRTEGEGSGLGAVAGGVIGAVVGHQVGAGRGKEAMTVLGAIGGAVGGHEVEKQVKAKTQYFVDVRMADGSTRSIAESAPPQLAVGMPVRVQGNNVVPR